MPLQPSPKERLSRAVKDLVEDHCLLHRDGIRDRVVAVVEQVLIEDMLSRTWGNKSKAARALGMCRGTLLTKAKGFS